MTLLEAAIKPTKYRSREPAWTTEKGVWNTGHIQQEY